MAIRPHASPPSQHLLRAAAIGGLCGAAFGFAVAVVAAAMTPQLVGWARWFYLVTFAAVGVLTAVARSHVRRVVADDGRPAAAAPVTEV